MSGQPMVVIKNWIKFPLQKPNRTSLTQTLTQKVFKKQKSFQRKTAESLIAVVVGHRGIEPRTY